MIFWRRAEGSVFSSSIFASSGVLSYANCRRYWAKTASRQHEIAGWMMRVLEDNPTLPSALLNAYQPGVFYDDEAVEVTLAELTTEDLFHIWEVMINHVYQLSVPYVARMVQIESRQADDVSPLARERINDLRPMGWMPIEVKHP